MNSKTLIWIGIFVGSAIGGYIPVLFGADTFGIAGIIGSTIGGFVGIWGGYRLSQMI